MTRQELVEKAIKAVHEREGDYQTALEQEADAEHEFKVQNAKAFLKASGGADLRKMEALVETEELHKDYLKKQAIAAFTKEKLKDAQAALSARQSLLSYEARTNFGSMGAGA
jgi:peptide methionine sulfoxide reductase MsrA